ncbi:MAG: TonB family protein, partial [Acidobacteria bacterium]|nr:TonB family protein [Acidobacteriota bacterium]
SLAKSVKKCAIHSGHHYNRELSACPWCEIEVGARVRLFNLANGVGSRTTFHLDEVWKEIEAVLPPTEETIPAELEQAFVTLSSEALELERKRRRDMWTSIGFSLIAGLLLSLMNHPFVYLLVLMAMVIAFVLANIGFDRRNTSYPNAFIAFDDHPIVDRIYKNKKEAESKLQETEEKWKIAAATERFLDKVSILENQREKYQNLPKFREWRLKELESAGRDAQLREFLGRFSIVDAEMLALEPGTLKTLHNFGIKTAADITEERINQTLGNDTPYGVFRLIAWRRVLEKQFIFDHDRAIPPRARVKVEREIDHLRLQLETELRTGARYLRNLKRDIEKNRKELSPALADARRSFAAAISDWNLVIKRNKIFPAIITLLIAFFIGSAMRGKWIVFRTEKQATAHDSGVGPGRGGNIGGGDTAIGDGRSIEPMTNSLKPTILYKEKAKYTEEERQNKIQGIVILNVVFTADARITSVKVVRGLPDGLTEKAIEAAQKIRFQPAVEGGQPVSVRGNLEFSFNLY